ncbi:MAG: hypothetical protein HOB29_13115 [Planctomycetaceae bacterium]|jgi:WD40 repeat protein|nr:hypothetical protein [Planctomycetaceae bacterium]MBT5885962.1 hypothetical protein [Planctomycetaceae bacterium]
MRKTTLIVVALMLLASNLLAADFVELKDVSGKHIIKVEINKVADGKVQVTDEKENTTEYPLGVFDRDSLILILNVVAKMKDSQPPNPFNNSTIVAANFVELKDVSGKHIIKVEINKVANGKVQVTDEKGKTAEYPLNVFDRDSLIILLNVVAKMKDVQKPNEPMVPTPNPPNPFNKFPIKTLTGTGHTGYITNITYSRDGQQIVTTSVLESNIWDANNISNVLHAYKVPTATAPFYSRAKMAGYGHDGGRIAVGVSTIVPTTNNFTFFQILEANTGKELHKFRSSQLEDSFTFSPDGKLIASMDGKSHMIRIRDFNTGKLLKTLVGTRNHTFIAYSPDSKRIVSGTIPIQERYKDDVFGGRKFTTNTTGEIYTTGEIEIWDVGTGKELHKLETTKLKTTAINCIAYSPNGQRIVGGCITNMLSYSGTKNRIPQNGLIIWDANTGKILHTFGTPHQAHTTDSKMYSWLPSEYSSIFLAYSPDGKRIASLGTDSTINIWDANTGKILHELRMPVFKEMEDERWFDTRLVCFAYSPDGKRIVGGGGSRWARGYPNPAQPTGMLCIWDANTGEILDASRSAIKK